VKRLNKLELEGIDREVHNRLVSLAVTTAKCWNEVNFLRKKQFRSNGIINFSQTYKVVYDKYKVFLKVNAAEPTRRNVEAWKSFFKLKEMKRNGELPKWLKPRPPGYWKDWKGNYKLIILIMHDRYTVDEVKRELYLKDFKLSLKFINELKWKGKQGRLEIRYDPARKKWYAFMPVEVEDRNSVPVLDQGMKAGVDLGIKNLAVMYVQDGSWYIFRGKQVFWQFEYYSEKIAKVKSTLSKYRKRTSRRLKLLYEKQKLNRRHAINGMVREIFRILQKKNVKTLVVGYPKNIILDHPNEYTVNFWQYTYTLERFKQVGEELGFNVIIIGEYDTSQECSICGKNHEEENQKNNENDNNNEHEKENNNNKKENKNGGRIKRGLYYCPEKNIIIHADLNGAINILSKAFPNEQWDKLNWQQNQPIIYYYWRGTWKQKPTKTKQTK
jgi:putative transposase